MARHVARQQPGIDVEARASIGANDHGELAVAVEVLRRLSLRAGNPRAGDDSREGQSPTSEHSISSLFRASVAFGRELRKHAPDVAYVAGGSDVLEKIMSRSHLWPGSA